MKHSEIITTLMNEILEREINYTALEKKLHDFKTLLLDITHLDLNNLEDRKDLQFDNGIALCTTFAALCTHDVMRTRQFIRGIYEAIGDVQKKKSEPIHLFYAGTGPFATLILPILSRISHKKLRLHLMDVNENTLEYLGKVLKALQIENYVEEIICGDATEYQIQNSEQIDILVSETMQQGLVKEQQVPIMINLVQQLSKESIVIPNNIRLDLALKSSSANLIMEWKNDLMYKHIARLWDFTPEFIHSTDSETKKFSLCEQVDFSLDKSKYDLLVVLTSIQVYKDSWIATDVSGLTIPRILLGLAKHDETKISLSYLIKKQPNFEVELQ